MANVENILDETGSVKAKLAEGNMRGVRGEEKATVVGATAARIADLLGQLKKEVSHTLTFDLLEARSVIGGAHDLYGEATQDIASLKEGSNNATLAAAQARANLAYDYTGYDSALAHMSTVTMTRQEMARHLDELEGAAKAIGGLAIAASQAVEQARLYGSEALSTVENYETFARGA